jgi:hypothetical protein
MSTNWRLWTVAAVLMACFLAHAERGICEGPTFTRVDLATQEDHSWGDVQVGDLNGDMDLVMRPIGFGGYREREPKAQYDVTIFFQGRTRVRP